MQRRRWTTKSEMLILAQAILSSHFWLVAREPAAVSSVSRRISPLIDDRMWFELLEDWHGVNFPMIAGANHSIRYSTQYAPAAVIVLAQAARKRLTGPSVLVHSGKSPPKKACGPYIKFVNLMCDTGQSPLSSLF